jgi:hypothetical protein
MSSDLADRTIESDATMAAMNLDQSLDDMIKETRKTAPKRRQAKSSAVRVAVGGKKRASTAKKTARGGPAPMAIGGGVAKGNRNAKKRGGNRSAAATAMAVDGVQRGGRGHANAVVGGKTKLMVGNLDYKVTDRDMKVRLGGGRDAFVERARDGFGVMLAT